MIQSDEEYVQSLTKSELKAVQKSFENGIKNSSGKTIISTLQKELDLINAEIERRKNDNCL